MTPKKILCPACGCLFGIEVNGVLNMKYRDVYRQVRGGSVEGPCRKCGEMVKYPLEMTIEKNVERDNNGVS
jgi:hypothetical protein